MRFEKIRGDGHISNLGRSEVLWASMNERDIYTGGACLSGVLLENSIETE